MSTTAQQQQHPQQRTIWGKEEEEHFIRYSTPHHSLTQCTLKQQHQSNHQVFAVREGEQCILSRLPAARRRLLGDNLSLGCERKESLPGEKSAWHCALLPEIHHSRLRDSFDWSSKSGNWTIGEEKLQREKHSPACLGEDSSWNRYHCLPSARSDRRLDLEARI